jgi:hypothetical protein
MVQVGFAELYTAAHRHGAVKKTTQKRILGDSRKA